MRSFSWFLASLLLTAPLCTASAADANGYTAQYECRAGGPKCNVDVATLAARSCDQTILSSDPDWSKITSNRSSNVFCIQAGDHSSKGPLTINFSGTASNHKVLRYYRPNDTGDDPWRQSVANRARINRIKFIGAHYWIVHRIVFDPNYASGSFAIHLGDPVSRSSHIIVNRVLAQHGAKQVYVQGANNSVIQNSVLRESIKSTSVDSDGIGLGYSPQNTWIVNNEIYRIYSHGFYVAGNSPSPGTVLENNDIYVDSSQYSDCRGNPTPGNPDSPCAAGEAAISLKSGGVAGNPVRIAHNRVWGHRKTDVNLCCISGGSGQLISLSDNAKDDPGAQYVIVQNNIITDAQHGIQTPRERPERNSSIVGNVLYRIKNYYATVGKIGSYALASLGHWDYNEVFLNTVVDSDSWANLGGGNPGLAVQCNAIVASGPRTGGTPDSSTIVNYNAFIGTPKFTTDTGTDTNVVRSTTIRANSTRYDAGSIVHFGPVNGCRTGTEAACFLYAAITTGISAGTTPGVCTQLGCQFDDGGVTWMAVRGPYFYKRQLRTVPQGATAFIPFARVDANAPESKACATQLGVSTGSGVDDGPVL